VELAGAIWIFLVIQALVCAGFSSTLAEKKGHSPGAWFAAGFFFGIFGLIAAAGLPAKPSTTTVGHSTKACPNCAEPIRREALVCKYCGRQFVKADIIAELISALQQKSFESRKQALEALKITRDDSVVPHVVQAFDQFGSEAKNLGDASMYMMNLAGQLLVDIGGQSIATQIVAILKKGGGAIKLRKVIEVLGSIRDPGAVPALIEALGKSDLHLGAANALYRIGKPAIPYLESFAKHAGGSHRRRAERVLKHIASKQ
jgi:HEAT repeat protein